MELKHVVLDTVVQTSEKNSMFVTAYEYLNVDIFFLENYGNPWTLIAKEQIYE